MKDPHSSTAVSALDGLLENPMKNGLNASAAAGIEIAKKALMKSADK